MNENSGSNLWNTWPSSSELCWLCIGEWVAPLEWNIHSIDQSDGDKLSEINRWYFY